MRNLDTLLISEMTPEEWQEFRRRWIAGYAIELSLECDASMEDAKELADIRFEDAAGQEAWTGRDERICAQRDAEKYFAG